MRHRNEKSPKKKVLMIYDNDWNIMQAVQMELFAFSSLPSSD